MRGLRLQLVNEFFPVFRVSRSPHSLPTSPFSPLKPKVTSLDKYSSRAGVNLEHAHTLFLCPSTSFPTPLRLSPLSFLVARKPFYDATYVTTSAKGRPTGGVNATSFPFFRVRLPPVPPSLLCQVQCSDTLIFLKGTAPLAQVEQLRHDPNYDPSFLTLSQHDPLT